MANAVKRRAVLYRMATPEHLCPSGLKAQDLLKRSGFDIEDHPLTSRAAIDAFKAEARVKTTPQVFIDGQRIGGYEALKDHLAKGPAKTGADYRPIQFVFGLAAAMAVAVAWRIHNTVTPTHVVELFESLSMCLLALLKLRDLDGFSTTFLGYDLLAQRFVPYAILYPFAEALAGVLMTAHALPWLSIPVALFIGSVGVVSVFKAVYVDKRELTCACVGGDSRVPLGFISLTENVMMVAMALWMLIW